VSNDNVVNLIQPGILIDQLTDVLRNGARVLLIQALEAEVSEFLAGTADLKTQDGCQRVVRHGHLPEREIMTGIGPVAVRQLRVRDRAALCPALEEPRYVDSDPLLERRLDRRFRGGVGRLVWQGCSWPVSFDYCAIEGRLAR
jgi:hypothetical protein